MAMKRCPDCGEKYSDTYKYCPFCEEEEILKKGKTGGRRARQERSFSLLTPVLVILILLMAGLLIFLLRGDKQPTAAKDPITPQPGVVTPVTPDEPDTAEPGTDEPDTEDPGVMPDEPDDTTTTTAPNTGSETGDYEKAMALPDGLTLSTTDFTMKSVGETATIRVSGGSGSYTWISEDDGIASVDSTGKVTINDRDIDNYFGLETLKLIVRSPLVLLGLEGKYDVVVRVSGGGVSGQAGAIRHGLSRALLQQSDENRTALKKAGFLTRDPRMKERKKYGLKAARRAPQFSKR